GAMARVRPPFALSPPRIGARRSVWRGAGLVPHGAAAGLAGEARMGRRAARQGRWRALWHWARRRGACGLPGHALGCDRHVIARVLSDDIQVYRLLTGFGYAALTIS